MWLSDALSAQSFRCEYHFWGGPVSFHSLATAACLTDLPVERLELVVAMAHV
ncbi:hypothetical protein SynMITS9220_02868 [Synechococcus sp. MIT S9220]|nr:hypothetical protein SynMITS9220_02868 [Synechococcus sp. MIT S9220]